MVSVTAVPVPLVFSSLLALREVLEGGLSFYSLLMEVDRKAGKRDTHLLPTSHKAALNSKLVEVPGSSTNTPPPSVPHFFNLNRGLVIHVLKSPARQGGQKYLPTSFVLTRILSVLPMSEARWDYISLCAIGNKRKLLRACCNVSRDPASCTQRKILVGLSCTGKQTERGKALLYALKGSKHSLRINM